MNEKIPQKPVILIAITFLIILLPILVTLVDMEQESKVRKCSSCKLVLPSHLFKNEQSSLFYKTCLPCRYKKPTLSNVPLSKREKADHSISMNNAHSDTTPNAYRTNEKLLLNINTNISSNLLSLIPQAKWVSCVSESSEHVFIASAVLTPLSLDRYTGSSRKYSVLN